MTKNDFILKYKEEQYYLMDVLEEDWQEIAEKLGVPPNRLPKSSRGKPLKMRQVWDVWFDHTAELSSEGKYPPT